MLNQFIFLAENVSAAFILWLGIFIITRDLARASAVFDWQHSPALFAGIATTLLAIYLFGVAMQTVARTPEEFILWQKSTWWTTPIAILAFFWSVLLLIFKPKITPLAFRLRLLLILLSLYTFFLVIGIIAGLFMHNAEIQQQNTSFETFYVPVRLPYFYFYNLFVAILLLICVTLLLNQWWHSLRAKNDEYQRFKWLGYGSLCLIVGALIGAVIHPLSRGAIPKQLGDYVLTLGAGTVSYGVARYNALAHEEIIEQDFWHSSLGVMQTAGFYVLTFQGLFWVLNYPLPPLATPLLLALAVITQTSFRWSDTLPDRLLLPQWAIGYRERLILLRHTLLVAKQPEKALKQAETDFQQIIQTVRQEEAEEFIGKEVDYLFQYTRLQNDKILAASQLQNLTLIRQALVRSTDKYKPGSDPLSQAQQARFLRQFLFEMIEQQLHGLLQTEATTLITEEEIEYLILYKKYVEQRSQTDIEQYFYQTHALVITGGSYSRRLTNARRRLTLALCQAELMARQA